LVGVMEKLVIAKLADEGLPTATSEAPVSGLRGLPFPALDPGLEVIFTSIGFALDGLLRVAAVAAAAAGDVVAVIVVVAVVGATPTPTSAVEGYEPSPTGLGPNFLYP